MNSITQENINELYYQLDPFLTLLIMQNNSDQQPSYFYARMNEIVFTIFLIIKEFLNNIRMFI